MFHTDVERADAAVADVAADAASFAAGALAVAVAAENGGVGNDDFDKTII